MHGIQDEAADPARLGWGRPAGHARRLFGELAERRAVLLGGAGGDLERALGRGVVRREQDAAIGLDGEHAIAGGEAEPLGHVLGQGRPDGTTDLAECQFAHHRVSVARGCYKVAQWCYWRKPGPPSPVNKPLTAHDEEIVTGAACDVGLPLLLLRGDRVWSSADVAGRLEWIDRSERILRHAERLVHGKHESLVAALIAEVQPTAGKLKPDWFSGPR